MFIQKYTEKRTKEQTSTFLRHNMVKRILRTDIIAFASWGFFCENTKGSKLEKGRFHLGSSGRPCFRAGSQWFMYFVIYMCEAGDGRICIYMMYTEYSVICCMSDLRLLLCILPAKPARCTSCTHHAHPLHHELLCSQDLLPLLLLKVIKISIQCDNILTMFWLF